MRRLGLARRGMCGGVGLKHASLEHQRLASSAVCAQAEPVLQEYARSRTDCAELMDVVAAGGGVEAGNAAEQANGKPAKRKRIYEDHRPLSDVTAGIKSGRYHQVGP